MMMMSDNNNQQKIILIRLKASYKVLFTLAL